MVVVVVVTLVMVVVLVAVVMVVVKMLAVRCQLLAFMEMVLGVLVGGYGGGHPPHPPSHTFLGTCLESTQNTKTP